MVIMDIDGKFPPSPLEWPYRVILDLNANRDAIKAWMKDNGTGKWTWYRAHVSGQSVKDNQKLVVRFTDERTAFEFKLAFG